MRQRDVDTGAIDRRIATLEGRLREERAHPTAKSNEIHLEFLLDAIGGIPTLVLVVDLADNTYVTEEQLKDKLEGFLEVLDDRKPKPCATPAIKSS